MAKVYVVATIQAASGKEEEMGRVLSAVIADVRAEKGCVRYDLHRSGADPARYLFYEIWESAEELAVHGETAHIAVMRERMAPLLTGEPEIVVYDAVDVSG